MCTLTSDMADITRNQTIGGYTGRLTTSGTASPSTILASEVLGAYAMNRFVHDFLVQSEEAFFVEFLLISYMIYLRHKKMIVPTSLLR